MVDPNGSRRSSLVLILPYSDSSMVDPNVNWDCRRRPAGTIQIPLWSIPTYLKQSICKATITFRFLYGRSQRSYIYFVTLSKKIQIPLWSIPTVLKPAIRARYCADSDSSMVDPNVTGKPHNNAGCGDNSDSSMVDPNSSVARYASKTCRNSDSSMVDPNSILWKARAALWWIQIPLWSIPTRIPFGLLS